MFSVSCMTADLTEFVYFDLTFTFDIFPYSINSNYVNMLRNFFTYVQTSFPFFLLFSLFLSYTKSFGVRKGCVFWPDLLMYVLMLSAIPIITPIVS